MSKKVFSVYSNEVYDLAYTIATNNNLTVSQLQKKLY